MISMTDNRPYINVIFGNFYSPAYDDEAFIDETMELIKGLGFNSVMFDTKAWEDFKERCETGALSQYVKMQEYMGASAHAHGLAYNFLLLYMNGDNLYPHIRFSPPIFGEETVYADGRPGKWYKYWSEKARRSMQEHVERIMDRYGDGCERCLVIREGKTQEVIPVCSMWDPIVSGSFDEEGIRRYVDFLRELYGGEIGKLNRAYGITADSFEELRPEAYWFSLRYGEDCGDPSLRSESRQVNSEGIYLKEEDVQKRTPRFIVFRDNALWKARELTLYFAAMREALREKNPQLFLCPDMTQWGYFLNIYGRQQADGDNEFSDLWDTALRGIDLYALAPYVDSCHFITVPVTPDGSPDAYVVSCQHSMMRVMNEGRPMIGGIYWGRYIYQDIYAFLTPAEIIGTMTACGMDGYTCYGMNGLDDGGVLNRMEPDFLESLTAGNRWCAEVIPQRKGRRRKEIALLFPSEMALVEPFEVGNNKIRRLDLLGWYRLCCDLGYQVDVISSHEIEKGILSEYRVLIVPANDCYGMLEKRKSEERITDWVKEGGILLHGPNDTPVRFCFGIAGERCEKMPYRYGKTIIPQGESFCIYHDGIMISDYVDGSCCVAQYTGEKLTYMSEGQSESPVSGQAEERRESYRGAVFSFGVEIGASYAAKNIPHVPYEQGNKEMYPIIQSKTTLVKDILERYVTPSGGIRERGIETGVFDNGMVIVNHRSTAWVLPEKYETEYYQMPVARTADGRGILPGHSAVWVGKQFCNIE